MTDDDRKIREQVQRVLQRSKAARVLRQIKLYEQQIKTLGQGVAQDTIMLNALRDDMDEVSVVAQAGTILRRREAARQQIEKFRRALPLLKELHAQLTPPTQAVA